MVDVILDGKKYTAKEVTVDNWSGHAHQEFIHYFSDDYDGADKMVKRKK